MSTKVLVIAYFSPPDATGVRRLISHLQYWAELNIEPIILTCKQKRSAGWDAAILQEPWWQQLQVVQTESWDPYRLLERFAPSKPAVERPTNTPNAATAPAKTGGFGANVLQRLREHFFLPDDRSGWIPFAVAEGERLIKRHKITAIYTSNYPQSAHVVGLRLKQRTGVHWVADFRDGWTQNPAFFCPANPFLASAQHRLERQVANTADELITVSPPITRHLQALRDAALSPAQTIFNGYDPADYGLPANDASLPEPFHPGCLTILYTGTFFGRRHPRLFLRLIAALRRRSPYWRRRLRVRFRCALSQRDATLAKELGLLDFTETPNGTTAPCLEILPSIPFAACSREQQRADVLLLVLEHGPGAEIMVSQKVFEYLGARRPIYALVPQGAAAEVLKQTGGALVHAHANTSPQLKAFASFLRTVEKGEFPLPDEENLKTFHRREQALAIGKLLQHPQE